MIKYYSITNNQVIEHDISKEEMKKVHYKLTPRQFYLLHELASKTPDSSDEETLNFIDRVLSDSKLSHSSNLKIIKAFLVGEFVVDISKRYFIHILPGDDTYLNLNSEGEPFLNDMYQWGTHKTIFTKNEIEDMKKEERFRGINFDECLEEAVEGEEW